MAVFMFLFICIVHIMLQKRCLVKLCTVVHRLRLEHLIAMIFISRLVMKFGD